MKDEIDSDAERFFRAVDRAVLEHHSRPSGLPLLLAALSEHHNLFRQVSHNPFLMAESIDIHPDALPIDALRDRAWRAVEPLSSHMCSPRQKVWLRVTLERPQ